MKWQKLALPALILAAVLLVSGCSSPPKETVAETEAPPASGIRGQSATTMNLHRGQPGGLMVQTYQKTARVTAIDKTKREVTLVTPDGIPMIVTAGPDVANFEQIQLGDRVKATITEELVVFMRKSGAPAEKQSTVVALAPAGAKPGIVTADTVEIAGKVTAIDRTNHLATLQFADGHSRTFRVREDVDLAQRSVGEQVVIRSTRAMALLVEKP